MTIALATRQAILKWARNFIAAYQLPARQTNKLTRHVARVCETNITSGRFARFASASGQSARVALRLYVQQVATITFTEHTRVVLLEQGDRTAWYAVQALLTRRAYHILRMLRDTTIAQAEAPDFANDTCAIIFTKPFPYDVAFEAWATVILKNRIFAQYTRSPDVLNHEPFRVSLEATSDLSGSPTLEITLYSHDDDHFDQIQDRIWVQDAINQLASPAQRKLVQAIHLDQKTFAEYAAQIGVSLQATYNLHHRAIRQLKKILLATTPQEKRAK